MFGMKPTEAAPKGRILKVGIIGFVYAGSNNTRRYHALIAHRCGMVTQVVHIPTLNYMSHLFQITYLCDVSHEALEHSQLKVAGASRPKTTRSCEELCTAPDVDLVIIASNHPLHASQAELALQANKYVFVEKPIALTLQDTDRIIAAEKAAGGDRVFIGYMRRYAAAFVDAVKEVGSIEQIRYARVRDIIGPNSIFVGQSGTYPRTFSDYREEDTKALRTKTREDVEQALQTELGIAVTEKTEMMWEFLSMSPSWAHTT